MNFGYSSRLSYDEDAYSDKLSESTYSLNYRINANQINNENKCRSKFGPRTGYMGHGVSTPRDIGYAEAQDLIEVDSIFSNRNTKHSKSKKGSVNPENPLEMYKLYDSNMCSDYLDPLYSKDTHAPSNYRGMEVNRFYNLPRNPQNVIFEDFSVNTRLEAKDNYRQSTPQIWPELAGPKPDPNFNFKSCVTPGCDGEPKQCPQRWIDDWNNQK